MNIPYIPELDTLSTASELSECLEARGAHGMIDKVNWPEAEPYRPLAAFAIAHSGTAVYIDFFSRGLCLSATNSANQSPVSRDSCVEFFVEPKPGGEYWNFEFNCIGAVNASHRLVRPEPVRLTDAEIARIKRYPSVGTEPFDERPGMHAWSLLVVIPLDMMGVKFEGSPIEMRANFYKVASASSRPHYLTWHPVGGPKPDFHRPVDFGSVTLEGAKN